MGAALPCLQAELPSTKRPHLPGRHVRRRAATQTVQAKGRLQPARREDRGQSCGARGRRGAEISFLAPVLGKQRAIYQDRLGTNIGKVKLRGKDNKRFLQGLVIPSIRSAAEWHAEQGQVLVRINPSKKACEEMETDVKLDGLAAAGGGGGRYFPVVARGSEALQTILAKLLR